jgi:hypothetical protein
MGLNLGYDVGDPMLNVPKSILATFADYEPIAVDAKAALEFLLTDSSQLASSLNLIEIRNRGIENEWTSSHLAKSAVELAHQCIRSKRYFQNVSLLSVEDGRQRDVPPASEPLLGFKGYWQSIAKLIRRYFAEAGQRRPTSKLVQSKLFWEGPCWAHRPVLPDRDLVLVDAPLCCLNLDQSGAAPFLCDYPAFLRRPEDSVVRLRLAPGVQQRALTHLPANLEWYPFVRILGNVRLSPENDEIDVMALFLAQPGFIEANWQQSLFAEAQTFRYMPQSQQKLFLLDGFGVNTLLLEKVEDEAEKASIIKGMALFITDPDDLEAQQIRDFIAQENDIDNDSYGFWPKTIAILHMWPSRFSLSRNELDGLLNCFDHTFTEEWKAKRKLLEPLDLFRFTGESVASMRDELLSLARSGSGVTNRNQEATLPLGLGINRGAGSFARPVDKLEN